MKLFLRGIAVAGMLFLAACSEQGAQSDEVAFLDVAMTVSPEAVEPEESVLFEAMVTYGNKPVIDADEVKFEIWHAENGDNREVIEVEHAGDGLYTLEKSFVEEGTYYVYAHVTAEGMHAMPKKEFVIGKPSENNAEEHSSSTIMDEDSSEQ